MLQKKILKIKKKEVENIVNTIISKLNSNHSTQKENNEETKNDSKFENLDVD